MGNSPRDNVIFELGLLIGILGTKKTFFVHERASSLQARGLSLDLPTDLAGVTPATFDFRDDDDFRGALGTACYEIESAISVALKGE